MMMQLSMVVTENRAILEHFAHSKGFLQLLFDPPAAPLSECSTASVLLPQAM